ncbi:MAG: Maf family protein [Thermodesulfobacteriota bacterium]
MPLILASSSPRRKELLERLGIEFEVIPSLIDEVHHAGESPEDFTLRVSSDKALYVAAGLNSDSVVIGADTIVVIDGEILGKPRDAEDAKSMLGKISGREHRVITGFSIVKPKDQILHREHVESRVKIKTLAPWEIEGYIKTREPMDKAGAYGAQGIGAFMIEQIQGSYTNVVGLPLSQMVDVLTRLGILKLFSEDGNS